jgi:uncharacterized membrane protein (DUF441 family)
MLSQASIFLLILLAIAAIAKNQSLIIAIVILLAVKWFGFGEKLFPLIQGKGINWGVTIITIAVLVPVATGDIGFKQLSDALKSSYAWIALISGMLVALIAARGIHLLQDDPHITTALVVGTIFAVAFMKGVAVGPLIGAGIAYFAMKVFQFIQNI